MHQPFYRRPARERIRNANRRLRQALQEPMDRMLLLSCARDYVLGLLQQAP